jgi:hypothetical protein
LDDQRWHRERVELGDPARARSRACTLRRLQRKRKTKDTDRSGCLRRAAGYTRTRRAASGDERETGKLIASQTLDDCRPGRVQLMRRRGRAATGDAIGLLDESNDKALDMSGVRDGDQIGCSYPSSRTMTKHERAGGTFR